MADLEKQIQKAVSKKGGATRKQTKLTEQIAKQENEIAELQKKKFRANKTLSVSLREQIFNAQQFLKQLKVASSENKADIRGYTADYKKYKKELDKITKAGEKAQRLRERIEAKAQRDAQKKWQKHKDKIAKENQREKQRQQKQDKWIADNARGTTSYSTSYDKMGLSTINERVSKLFKDEGLATAGLKNAIQAAQKKQGFVPSSLQHRLYQTKTGEWGFDMSAKYQEQAPGKSISARIWDGVKLAAESIKEVIEKIINGLKKFLGGIAKFVKGLYRFGKNVLKIALGLPLFTALFSKLASLNGLNAMEFAGRSTGAGNAVTDRGLKIFENMYGTDGSLSNIAANRMDLVSNPANLRFLQMIGMSDEEIKNKDANMFALSYAKKLSSWFQTQSGMSLDEIRKNPTDSRVRSAYSAYNASGLGDKMSVASLLGYENAFKNGLDKELESYSKGEHRLYKLINEQNGLKQERGYQASIIEWQNMWIKLATKIQPYMSEISDGLARLASGFIDLLFNNGGFQKMVDIFMSAFRKLTAWLKSKEVQEKIENILDWLGSKLEGAWNFLTTKDASGKTGLDIITETLSGLWATLKEILGHIADIALWIGDKLGLTNYSKMQDKHGFLKMGRLDFVKSWNLGGLDYKYEDMLLRNGGVNNRAYQQRRKENQINLQDMMADIKPEIIKNMTAGEAQAYLDAMVAGNKINPYGNDQEKYNYVVFESILSVLQSINGKINTSTPLRVSAQGNGF